MTKIKETIQKIEMPSDMQKRILRSCYEEIGERQMKREYRLFRKPAAVFAAFLLCFLFASAVGYAASERLQGSFRDIKNHTGAVTGTAYDQADDEILITASKEADTLNVEITFALPDQFPYRTTEELTIKEYELLDENGNTLAKDEAIPASPVKDGKASFRIPCSADTCTLIIHSFESRKKADQPLVISGSWEVTAKK